MTPASVPPRPPASPLATAVARWRWWAEAVRENPTNQNVAERDLARQRVQYEVAR